MCLYHIQILIYNDKPLAIVWPSILVCPAVGLENTIDSYEAGFNTSIGKNVYNTFKTELSNIKKLIGEETN